ncbi:AraC-type DNA-binding protein [Enhydrobacter aerosaccus]|uniref:AraC-type DNA-binding protein n=1 Tax=Enhydrobacter aerosaccus TaxID=225324 RepID=A0A1T4PCA3_9HYPH|nr:helix-turn-helix domain-containing protein [Enhydrobacter aerosaccus]SJZ89180.1 AraC-type DNA-binding protein [Enhydrobacter aerosaccus]
MLLETGLRGGAFALIGILAIIGLPGSLRSPIGRVTLLLDLCVLAFLIETAPGLHEGLAWWIIPARILSNSIAGVFVAWAETVFGDAARPTRWRWAVFIALLPLATVATLSGASRAWNATHAATLIVAICETARVLAGRKADLVEGRRRLRVVFACAVGLVILTTTVLDAAGVRWLPGLLAILGVAVAAALLRLRAVFPEPTLAAAPMVPATPTPPAPGTEMSADERQLAERLRQAMERDRVYRDMNLSIDRLAERLGTPEYRLRRLINQRLGHRNFNDFVNQHRLNEARIALSDPAQARVPVLTIALDAGWGSIGPFNRAFKAQTGQTPTEFRRRALADSEIGHTSRDSVTTDAASGKTPTSA